MLHHGRDRGVPYGWLLIKKSVHRRLSMFKEHKFLRMSSSSSPMSNWIASFFLCGETQDKSSFLLLHHPPFLSAFAKCLSTGSFSRAPWLTAQVLVRLSGRVIESKGFQAQYSLYHIHTNDLLPMEMWVSCYPRKAGLKSRKENRWRWDCISSVLDESFRLDESLAFCWRCHTKTLAVCQRGTLFFTGETERKEGEGLGMRREEN